MRSDVSFAFRLLRRSPGFTATAVLTLALGIGANTAIFGVVHRIVLDPLQVEAPERLVTMHWQSESGRLSGGSLFGDYVAWRDEAAAFAGVAAEGRLSMALGSDAAAEQVSALLVSAGYFDVLGLTPQVGRWFLAGDDTRNAQPVAVLSDRLWRRRFSGDPGIVGQSVRVTAVPATVVGVAPPGFGGTDLRQPADLFLPLMAAPAIAPVQQNFFSDVEENGFSPSAWLRVIARLDAGAGIDGAQTEADAIARRRREQPGRREPPRVRLIPATQAAVPLGTRGETIRFAAVLAGVAGLVLLVGCANLAGLLLARADGRRRELAVRRALGATRRHLVQQLLTESLLLALAGGAGGLLVARWLTQGLSAFELPGRLRLGALTLGGDVPMLAYAALASVATALLCGVVPAWRASNPAILSTLRVGATASNGGRSRTSALLAAAQVAMSLVLLVGAGLFAHSLRNALRVDLGFDPDGLVVTTVAPALGRYDGDRAERLFEELRDRAAGLPGVVSASVGGAPLIDFTMSTPSLDVDGDTVRVGEQVLINPVGPEYFRTLGLPVLKGRALTARDGADAPAVAVVNASLARRLWGDRDPLGRHLGSRPTPRDAEVVGVVGDAKLTDLARDSQLCVYIPRDQAPMFRTFRTSVIARTSGDPSALVSMIRRVARDLDPDMPLARVTTVGERVGELSMSQRMGATLLGWFSALALALAALGVYGLVTQAVHVRTPEIGLRVALGAEPGQVLRLMLARAWLPVVAGATVGLGAAVLATRFVSSFLFGITATDPASFIGATAMLLAVAFTAAYLPARRATRVEPMVALRSE